MDYQLSKGNQPVVNMLNTKYIVQGKDIVQNPNACGNAWFANKVTYANGAKEIMRKLDTFDACNEAVVDNTLKNKLTGIAQNGNGKITLTENKGDKLVYNIQSNRQSNLAVFSEIFYKAGGGWKASIDGKAAEVLKVNYALRGLVVPKNAKQIVFEFNPSFYRTGELISGIFSLLFLGALAFMAFRFMQQRKLVKQEQ